MVALKVMVYMLVSEIALETILVAVIHLSGLRLLFAFENFEGKTNLGSLMFTPIGEAGYHFVFGDHIFTTPSIAYGYQIKVTKEHNTRDQDEGGRIIPGLAAGYRF
jgi:hypothetical protein